MTGQEFEFLLYAVDEGRHVATVTLNRPRYRNALSRRLSEELDEAFALAAADDRVAVIVLKAAGTSFSSGHDLGTPEELADRETRPWGDSSRDRYLRSHSIDVDRLLRIRNNPKPTVAAVQGHCIFAGWMLASAMDVIIAGEGAQFLATHFQYFSVPWDMGVRNAKGALFENRFLSADEAHRMGLVYRVVPDDRLEAEVDAYADRVAASDSFRNRIMKRAINGVEDQNGFASYIETAHTLMMAGSGDNQMRDPSDGRVNSIVAQAKA